MNQHWQGRRRPSAGRFLIKALCVLLCVAVLGAAVMLLWNWVLPGLIPGTVEIGFWRALGLLALCRILFGGFKGGGHWREKRRMMRARWQAMTPEEREKVQARFGMFGCRNRRQD